MNTVKRLVYSARIIAVYIVIMYLTQGFAFGPYQIRIATALYSLSFLDPFLIVPLGIANLLSNIMGGFGMFDIIGGFIVGIITSGAVYLVKRFRFNRMLVAVPIILGPGLIVPIWLSYLTHIPYGLLVLSVCIGQVLPGITGVVLIKYLEKVKL